MDILKQEIDTANCYENIIRSRAVFSALKSFIESWNFICRKYGEFELRIASGHPMPCKLFH